MIGPLLLIQEARPSIKSPIAPPRIKFDAVAIARIRASLEADVNDEVVGLAGGLDHGVAFGEREAERFLGVKMFVRDQGFSINLGVEVARQGDQHRVDIGSAENEIKMFKHLGAFAGRLVDDSLARRRCFGSSSAIATIFAAGNSRAVRKRAVPRLPTPMMPKPIGRDPFASPTFPCATPSPPPLSSPRIVCGSVQSAASRELVEFQSIISTTSLS